MEANVVSLLCENGIQQPRIIKIDASLFSIPYEYGIYEDAPGEPLAAYLLENKRDALQDIYTALGKYYRRFAEIPGPFAGVWDKTPDRPKYKIHPADAMLMLEVEGGSGKSLLDKGIISREIYDRIIGIWKRSLPKLRALPVHLTHFSAFPWSVYLSYGQTGCFVSKITALLDILWWNEHATIAHILYPPYFHIGDDLRQSFLRGYARPVDFDIIDCFLLLYRLCAINGVYRQPEHLDSDEWRAKAVQELTQIDGRHSV
jgi:hypothetical protein